MPLRDEPQQAEHDHDASVASLHEALANGFPEILASILDVRNAAKVLGLSEVRVKQLAQQGRIGHKIAGRYLFLPQELEEFKKLKRPPGPKPRSKNS